MSLLLDVAQPASMATQSAAQTRRGLPLEHTQPLSLTPENLATETPAAPQRARVAADSPRLGPQALPPHAPRSSFPITRWRVLLLLGATLSLAAGLASAMLGMWAQDPLPTPAAAAEPASNGPDRSAASRWDPEQRNVTTIAVVAPAADTPTLALPSNPGRKSSRVPSPRPDFVAQRAQPDALQTAYAALAAGQLGPAAQLYGERLDAHPEECDALLGLAYIAHRTGHRDEALAYYQRVLRQDPDHTVAHAGLLALNSQTDLTHAASRAREMADRHPDSAATLAALGGILVRQGRLAEATQALARAQSLEPGNATYAYNLGVAQDQLHQYRLARGAYERAIALSASSAAAGEHGFLRETAQQRLEQLRTAAADQPRAQP